MAVNGHAYIELALVLFAIALFVTYNGWVLSGGRSPPGAIDSTHYLFGAGRFGRVLWVKACAKDPQKEAILAVQTIRNALMAISYLATISGVVASGGLAILLNEGVTTRIKKLSENDLIASRAPGKPLIPATMVMVIALGVLFVAFVCFTQSVRLYVHIGFFMRAVGVTTDEEAGDMLGTELTADGEERPMPTVTVDEVTRLTLKAAFAYTLGLRTFYLFIVLAIWSAGPTALLVSSIVMTLLLWKLDRLRMN